MTLRERYLNKLRRLGQLSFEERLNTLFDPGTLTLIGSADWETAWASSLVGACGLVEGRKVYAYASNFLVQEGTVGLHEADLVGEILKAAQADGAPVVALLHSNGARVSERYDSLAGNARMFKHITQASGTVPLIAACSGLSLGVAAYMAALSDFVFMIPGKSFTATTSPAVIKAATGQSVTLEELGGAAMHAEASGVAHFLAESDESCLLEIRRLLGYLKPQAPACAPDGADVEAVVPSSPYVPYDVCSLIGTVFDEGTFLEVHEAWAKNMVVGFARLEGRAVGIVANQSKVKSGTLDVEASRKASRFIQTADSWGIPLVYLVDVPGIMVSPQEERKGILGAGAVLFHAVNTDVARISLVVRKCFGGAFVMLQARQAGGDRILSYPTAQIGIAGAEASFAILHGKEHKTHEAPAEFKKEQVELLKKIPSDAYAAQEAGIVDKVISPRKTREELILALAEVGSPQRDRPKRRHPNLPV